jgi:uncharacterized membrane protein YqaE (UPF0057 family)
MENACPHCNRSPCLSVWRKLMLGPGATFACAGCSNRVGIEPVRASLVMLPIVLLTVSVAVGWFKNALAAAVLLLLLLPICGLLYAYWVPLRAAGKSVESRGTR